jgi:long-subunit fatty acid transport protein
LSVAAGYSHYSSDITRSDSATATIGVAHQLSPELTISASAGGFWSDTEPAQAAPIATGEQRRATGSLFGGSLNWAVSERTQFLLSVVESLAPSGAGLLGKTDNAGASLTHKFSERLTGRLGAGYTRTIFPQARNSSFNNDYYQAEVGVSYRLAERWTLDAGYRYSRAQYSQNSQEPTSNVGFVTIGYNWPGTSLTSWVGRPPETPSMPGAGPLSLPAARGASGAPPTVPESSPFEPFTLP